MKVYRMVNKLNGNTPWGKEVYSTPEDAARPVTSYFERLTEYGRPYFSRGTGEEIEIVALGGKNHSEIDRYFVVEALEFDV